MMSRETQSTPQSHSASESDDDFFRRWDLPDVTTKPVSEQQHAIPLPKQLPVRSSEPEEVPLTYTMTAEALEELRQTAYDEGFEQGQQDGFAKGHPEGVAAGHQQGLQQGQEEGLAQGLAEGQSQIQACCDRLDTLMQRLHQPQQQLDLQVEQQLIALTSQLAQAVVQHELQTNPAIILHTLREAVRLLPFHQQLVRVQLNPSDLELIQQNYSDDQIAQRGWRLEAEAALPVGDLRLLTEQSDVSIDMQQRMARVSEIFLAQLNRHRSHGAAAGESHDTAVE